MSAVDARWEAFLAKVAERLESLIAEAGDGLFAVARANPDDLLVVGNALTGLDFRVGQLVARVDEAWEEQVEALLRAEGDAAWDRGLDRKADAELALRQRWEAAKAAWLATLAHEARARAEREAAEAVACPRCGGVLALPTRRESVSVPCPRCGSVCQVASTPAARAWWGAGVEALAEEAALPLRFAIERSRLAADRERRDRGWRPEPLASLERWRAMELAYWQRRVEVRAEWTGDPPDGALVASRMRLFDQAHLHVDAAWVAAHGR